MNEQQASLLKAEIERQAARIRALEDFEKALHQEDRIYYDASVFKIGYETGESVEQALDNIWAGLAEVFPVAVASGCLVSSL